MIVDYKGWQIPLSSLIMPKRSHGVDIRIAEIGGVEKLVIVLDESVTDKQLREAGGIVTDFDGAQTMLDSGYIVASNSLIHQSMLDVLMQARV